MIITATLVEVKSGFSVPGLTEMKVYIHAYWQLNYLSFLDG